MKPKKITFFFESLEDGVELEDSDEFNDQTLLDCFRDDGKVVTIITKQNLLMYKSDELVAIKVDLDESEEESEKREESNDEVIRG